MPTVNPYPFDPTGTALSNLITGEVQVLTPASQPDQFYIVPTFGPYFSASLQVVHRALDNTLTTLTEGVDYYPTYVFIGASRACALPICGAISFLDLSLTGTVTLQYQTLGGDWTISQTQITAILADALYNPRTTAWEEVSGYPDVFPPIPHAWDLVDMVGMSDVVTKIVDLADAVTNKVYTGLDAHLAATNPHHITPGLIGTYTSAQIDTMIAAAGGSGGGGVTSTQAQQMINDAMSAHVQAADPHPQYDTDAKVLQDIASNAVALALIRQPRVLAPAANGATGASSVTIQGTTYYSLYGVPQNAAEFQVSSAADFSALVYDQVVGAVLQNTVPGGVLNQGATYFCRLRYQDTDLNWSQWSLGVQFQTGSATVATPALTAPANGAQLATLTPTLQATAFAMATGTDVYRSTDWEVWTGTGGTGTLAYSSYGDTVNTVQITVPSGTLQPGTTYYPRVRYNSQTSGASGWSAAISFGTTSGAAQGAPSNIGDAYAGGYFAGYMLENFVRYGLVVSPRAQGQIDLSQYPLDTGGQGGATLMAALSTFDGSANTQAMVTADPATYKAAARATALTINGYSDWYIPARDELELLFRSFKPYSEVNYVGAYVSNGINQQVGENDYSLPAGVPYSVGAPDITTVTDFQVTGAPLYSATYAPQAIAPAGDHPYLFSSTFRQDSSTTAASTGQLWRQLVLGSAVGSANSGQQDTIALTGSTPSTFAAVRLVRKVALPIAPGDAFGGGIFVGYIQPGDGHTYMLIMAPRATGLVDLSAPGAFGAFSTTIADAPGAHDLANGRSNTQALAALGQANYPLAYNLINGGVVIGGLADWYIPAIAEIEMLYRYFKPTSTTNVASAGPNGMTNGANPYSYPVGAAYTPSNPAQNTDARFQYNAVGPVLGSELISAPGKALFSSSYQNANAVWYEMCGITTTQAGQFAADSPTAWANANAMVHLVRRIKVGP